MTDGPNDTATKDWITEAATASEVAIDMINCDGALSDYSSPNWDDSDSELVNNNSAHEVCASAKTAGGQTLFGHTIAFSSSGVGYFTDANGSSNQGTSASAVIEPDGYAHVFIQSTEAGDQNVTASIDGQSDSGTETWTPERPRNIDCSPDTATNKPGDSHTVSCLVTDLFGNPVPNEQVAADESGPGSFQDPASCSGFIPFPPFFFPVSSDDCSTTDATGTAEFTTTSDSEGVETITATLVEDYNDGNSASDTDDECDQAAGDTLTGNDASGIPAGNCAETVSKTWSNETQLTRGACRGFFTNSTQANDASSNGGEVIVGSPGDDVLTGTDGDDIICGLGGNDTIAGGGGDDIVEGNGGDDTVALGAGDDTCRGGSGADTIKGGSGRDLLDGKSGNDTISGNDAKDVVRAGAGRDVVHGGRKNDLITGGDGNDTLKGDRGWDTIRGNDGRDVLGGGRGNDNLHGGKDNDTLYGFTGNDLIFGDRGTDTCRPGAGRDEVHSCER